MNARRADLPLSRAALLQAEGVLLVLRTPPAPPAPTPGQPPAVHANPAEGPEVLLAVWDDGSTTALNGHVDLGTGIQTALAQIVAEELDLTLACVRMALGDTARAPNQGATIASASIQIHAQPLRRAAAQARAWLAARGAAWLGVEAEAVETHLGVVRLRQQPARHVPYGVLLAGQRAQLMLDAEAPLKDPAHYRIVGTPQPRIDIPAKLSGETVFVHDLRLPGLLHGRVVRPPYAGADHGDFIGNTLEAVDERSVAQVPGLRGVVVLRDFVGVVAEREEHAEAAMRQLAVRWNPWPGMPELGDTAEAIRANPATARRLIDDGQVDEVLAGGGATLERTYLWPYQMHASIGPSCAVAQWQPDGAAAPIQLRTWAGTQNPHVLRADLARLMGLADVQVEVVRMEAAGCYGRNGADDVAADAALLARAVAGQAAPGQAPPPVRVQLTREQENAWDPKGTAQLMQVRGALDAAGALAAYDFATSYPSNGAPALALLLTGAVPAVAQAFEMGDRTARPPYTVPHLRVTVNDMPPIVRASWLRGVSALPNSFAHESFVDELAASAGADPLQFRLRHLHDTRAAELLQATADKAGWRPRQGPLEAAGSGEVVRGQGIAYARYVHSKWPGFGAAWSAWVADVEVNRRTGEVQVRRVVCGHDAGLLVNPAGATHQVHGNVLQTTSRALKEQVAFAPHDAPALAATRSPTPVPGVRPAGTVLGGDWGSYPILNFREVPVVEVLHMPRPGEAPLGAGESSSVPGTAAIANAIFDATGVRLRAPPFTPEVVREGLAAAGRLLPPTPLQAAGAGGGGGADASNSGAAGAGAASVSGQKWHGRAPWPRGKRWWAGAGALAAGALGAMIGLAGWRPAIAPVAFAANAYSAETIERGRVLAAAGDCMVCHTAPGGARGAGGLAMQTDFGTVFSTNLTPDADTGLGRWSFSAFQRAMREGISRDGRHLYPVFPYTAFAKVSDDDLQALYAYLMSQPAVRAPTPPAQMRFPFSQRALLPVWNALHLDARPYQPVPTQSAEWNRGAYLVQGLGHCGACHTPRGPSGAELGGAAFLSGAMVDGWEAPALTTASKAAVPWDAEALYRYLRDGHSPRHGSAGGLMAHVVRELQDVPDADLHAMATYLASFNPPVPAPDAAVALDAQAQQVVARAAQQADRLIGPAQRLFDSACASCHHDGDGPTLLGVNTPLALSSKLGSDRPDNLIRTILEGVREPATRQIGFMQPFADVLTDQQIAELAGYLRARFAPERPAWADLPAQVARVRAASLAATH